MNTNAVIGNTGARAWLCMVMALLACTAFAAVPAASPELAAANSRYIFLPPIDDGGRSSGAHAVTICLPAGYASTDRRYPVIYLLDGEAAFLTSKNGMSDTIAYELAHDELVHEGLIEPAILVAIHNSLDAKGAMIPGNRYLDYCVTGQTNKTGTVVATKSAGYYDYLANTIKPLIDTTYRTRPEPASTGVAGFSAGGAGAFWMTYLHPETFGMAICQSPPFWTPYVGKEFMAVIEDTRTQIPAVRLWLDAGSNEFDFIYKDAYAAYRKLVARGFRQNENIAFYTGHNHGHEKFDCHRRLRAALYFMLRTQPSLLTGAEITQIESEALDGTPINLLRPGHVVVEAVYDNWLRLTDCTAEFTIANAKVATLNAATNELRPNAAGRTTVTSTYNGRKIVREVSVIAPEPQQPCYATKTPIVIDGELADWPKLPMTVDTPQQAGDAPAWHGAADLSYRFGCMYDDAYLYLAIQTTDQYLNSVPEKDPWFQDGVEVRIDARPAKQRLFGEGIEFQDYVLVAISPGRAGETRMPVNAAKLPAGTRVVCTATASGHNTEIAIPVAYLNGKAGAPWRDVRLNVVVNDLDDDYQGFRGDKLWWRYDWRYPQSTWGSGTFQRR